MVIDTDDSGDERDRQVLDQRCPKCRRHYQFRSDTLRRMLNHAGIPGSVVTARTTGLAVDIPGRRVP